MAHFDKAGALIETQLDALHAQATCLVRLRQLDAAIDVLRRTVTLEPANPRRRKLLAAVQLMAGKPQDAMATLAPLLADAGVDAETLGLASAALQKAGDTPQAVSALRRAILLEPRNVDLYLDFANIAFAHQSFQVGIEVLSDGLGLQPSAAPLYVARGVLYVQLADYERAEADFAKASELDPNQALSDAAQGLAAAQENDLDRALATIRRSSRRSRTTRTCSICTPTSCRSRAPTPGRLHSRRRCDRPGKPWRCSPGSRRRAAVLAKLHLQAGRHREAIEQCRRALAIDPNDQTSLYRLIQALRKSGDKSEIPALLKRLAAVREQAAKEERERYRYRLVIGEPSRRRRSLLRQLRRRRLARRRARWHARRLRASALSRRASRPHDEAGGAPRAVGASVQRAPGRRGAPRRDSASRSSTAPVETKKYILETIGCGCAFFDYDNDGWMDVFILGGTRLDGDPPGATNRLYKNNRDGTFTDVTAQGRPASPPGGRPASASVTTTTTASRISSARPSARTGSIATTATARSPT